MRKHSNDRLQGTLDMLVLKALASQGRMHGYAVTLRIEQISASVLRLEEGSLYPALHRMTHSGWLRAEWGASENGSEQESEKGAILRCFAENKEFSLERRQSLRLQQQVTEILVSSPAA